MNNKRRQLTLFIDGDAAAIIEKIRYEFNPLQYALINAHVTICREDELECIDKVMDNLRYLNSAPISIDFGRPVRFSEGTGVLIPALPGNTAFQKLRINILKGVIEAPRQHEPHITLMHPRNSTCTDANFETIQKISFPQSLPFKKISLIEQEAGQPWNIIQEFELK